MASGDAGRWTGLTRVTLAGMEEEHTQDRDVDRARSYRDRLVLKLRGVDDAGAARRLKGARVLAPADQVPDPPEGAHWAAHLVGLEVERVEGGRLGRVTDVVITGGTDVLVVEEPDGHELLVPMAREIVLDVGEARIVVRLPEGLRELNRRPGGERDR